MILLSGILFGILISIPPGPSSFAVMRSALERRWALAFKNVASFVAADVVVLGCVSLVFLFLGVSGEHRLLKAASALFLIGFGAKMFFSRASSQRASKNFFLTFMNPGIWMANFALISFWGQGIGSDFVVYVIGVQMGSIVWYSLLIGFFPRSGAWGPLFLTRIAPAVLLGFGVYLFPYS